jgi:hypothetical protein
MLGSALPATSQPNTSGNGGPSVPPPSPNVPPKPTPADQLRAPPPPDKRSSQSQPQKPLETAVPKRSGFGIFGKFKEEDENRDQLKRLKADNKRLREQLQSLEVKSNELGAENERYKTTMIGDRKINNQRHPDSYYSAALERLSLGIADWTVSHFRGKSPKDYTPEMIEEIRGGLKKLSEANNLIPSSLHWVDVDLQACLADSKFRIAFVQHVIGLHLHEKIFSPFSYEIEDFGLGYWLKRVSDEVARSGYTFLRAI